MNEKEILEKFRDLVITREELENHGGEHLLKKMGEAVVVCNQHIINLLDGYIHGRVTITRILEWVNTIWFSDTFDYCDEGCDCIASIMNRLEELDEGFTLDNDAAKNLVSALKKNVEI
ncbi:hypothetical protein [Haloplasma contractile]|uniref:Uncharacterized protein n=1 Tax=Haloplasma contractile SSD-17B TaxID=1033810 RepID=U2E799_9MOLU|nr:hypothetical protein [Haloplasma contractile]ERJ11073.1 hypothetical protein HLPCO_002894 [Haloplasma contractile SSD-17B]